MCQLCPKEPHVLSQCIPHWGALGEKMKEWLMYQLLIRNSQKISGSQTAIDIVDLKNYPILQQKQYTVKHKQLIQKVNVNRN